MLIYINLVHITFCKFNSHLISSSYVHYVAYPKYPHPLSDYSLWALLVPPNVLHAAYISLLLFTSPLVSSYSSQVVLSIYRVIHNHI